MLLSLCMRLGLCVLDVISFGAQACWNMLVSIPSFFTRTRLLTNGHLEVIFSVNRSENFRYPLQFSTGNSMWDIQLLLVYISSIANQELSWRFLYSF